MGCQQPHRRPGEADLQREKECLAVGNGEVHQRIRLTPAVLQVAQGQARIQERAPEDQQCEHHGPARQTIHIPMASLPSPPKAGASALPAEHTPERRGVRAAIRQAAPVERLFCCVVPSSPLPPYSPG